MPPSKQKIGLIILAAGNSSRMNGEPKQLLVLGGKTLLRRAAETAVQANFEAVAAVLGANAERFRSEIRDLPLQIVFNENWADGMSSSIKAGLTALSEEKLDAVIIMLCDQPLITAEILRKLRDAFTRTGKLIAACKYENTVGVPALFAREVFGDLMNLQADEGAKRVIGKYADKAALVTVPEASFDVDTVQDYEKIRRLSSR